MSQLADRFMAALRALERERDVKGMARMYAQDAELRRAPRNRAYRGGEGVRRFWQEYLNAFPEVETTFGLVTESEGRAVMEVPPHRPGDAIAPRGR